jgi:FSR family fosmidomycin resistance protein-like MFS transporter
MGEDCPVILPPLAPAIPGDAYEGTVFRILVALSVSHMLNDTMQSLIPAIYPLLKASFLLNYSQIGEITFTFQLTACILQPCVGWYTDRRPKPYSLAIGMGCTLAGLIWLSRAASFGAILDSSALVGVGSAIFHPEASRMARLASGGRTGFAQAIFQVGGNFGSSLGPFLAAVVVVPRGQSSILAFSLLAVVGIVILSRVGRWYARQLAESAARASPRRPETRPPLSRARVAATVGTLLVLIFSKYLYLTSLSSYYTFYLIDHFQVSVRQADYCLFIFLFAVAAGTIIGGPIGDRFGRKYVIWGSILGVAPFSLLLPYVSLGWTIALSVVIGVILASAFSAILVFAQDLIPGKPGTIAGLFFGFAFGIAGIGSVVLGRLADRTSIHFVFEVCGYLPLLGLFAAFLPNVDGGRRRAA